MPGPSAITVRLYYFLLFAVVDVKHFRSLVRHVAILIVSRQQDLIVILQSNLVLWLYICVELYRTVTLHTGTSRNQLTNDYVLLQTDQMVNLTIDSRLGQNLGGLLEGCCGCLLYTSPSPRD